MILFAKRVLVFFLILAVLTGGAQSLIFFRINGKTLRGDDDLSLTSNVNADVVFLGSSRCRSHFDPRYFDSVFHIRSVNIGVSGHSELSMAFVRLETYLLTNKAPRLLVLNFDPMVTAGSITGNRNFFLKNAYARYAFLPGRNDRMLVDYFQFNGLERYLPLYAIFKYQLLSDAIYLDHQNSYVKSGYDMRDEKWDTVALPLSTNWGDKYFKMSDTSGITRSLDSLNRFCQQRNIELICVQTPVFKVMYNQSLAGITRTICGNVRVPFIDAEKEFIDSDINCFYNPLHLNKSGVGRFSEFLAGDSTFRQSLLQCAVGNPVSQ